MVLGPYFGKEMTEQDWLGNSIARDLHDYVLQKCSCNPRVSRLFVAACCRQIWSALDCSSGSKLAVAIAEDFADGIADKKALYKANEAVTHDWNINYGKPGNQNYGKPGNQFMYMAAWVADLGLRRGMFAPMQVALSNDDQTIWNPALLMRTLRDFFGNPFQSVSDPWNCPWCRTDDMTELDGSSMQCRGCNNTFQSWITESIFGMAEATYEKRLPDGSFDRDRLLVLSDALEEAGADERCRNCVNGKTFVPTEPVFHADGSESVKMYLEKCRVCDGSGRVLHLAVQHLRSEHNLYRGAWSLDLILHKRP